MGEWGRLSHSLGDGPTQGAWGGLQLSLYISAQPQAGSEIDQPHTWQMEFF